MRTFALALALLMPMVMDGLLLAEGVPEVLVEERKEKKISNKHRNEINRLIKEVTEAEEASDYKKALKIQKELHSIYESVYKNKKVYHPAIYNSFLYLGIYNRKLNQFKDSEKNIKKAVEISKDFLDVKSTLVAILELADTYEEQFESQKASIQYLKAIELYESEYGKEYPKIGEILQKLAIAYTNTSNFNKAEDALLRAISIDKKNYYYFDSLALAYFNNKLFERSIEVSKKSISLKEKILGRNDLTFVNNFSAIATASFLIDKNNKETNSSIKRIEEILENNKESKSGSYATGLYSLANLNQLLGNYEKAINAYLESIKIYQKLHGSFNPYLANPYMNLGRVYIVEGDYDKAKEYFFKALENSSKFYGDNISYRRNLAWIGIVTSRLGNYSEAFQFFKESIDLELKYIQTQAPYTPQIYRDKSFSIEHMHFHLLWTGFESKKMLNLATYYWLNRKGLLEKIESYQSKYFNNKGLHNEIVKELNFVINKISSVNISLDEKNDLLRRKNYLEKKLYKLIPQLEPRIFQVEEIIDVIPENSVLIEYVVYKPRDQTKPLDEQWGENHYLALVLNPNGEKSAINLGTADLIDKKIIQALQASEEGLADAQKLWEEVGDLVIKPLKGAIGDSQTLFISPDAELNRIPFAAISSHKDDQLLVDAVKIRLLTTGRELLDLAKRSKSSKQKPLVVANPSFNLVKTNQTKQESNLIASNTSQQRSGDLTSFNWIPLPGTEKEGKAISKLTNAQLLTKNKASALAIQEQQQAPKVLHIASHAYFLADQKKGENPLLRSGIVLAGANDPEANPKDDGYLTALEVTKLDWNGTELVVISGCESGKGDIQSGEGVYGLKRAIAVAGARSSLLSLWEVDDAATAAFMKSFYERLKKGEGKAEALAATQREFRNHIIPAWRHPYVWAAFQLSGDWRPIDW